MMWLNLCYFIFKFKFECYVPLVAVMVFGVVFGGCGGCAAVIYTVTVMEGPAMCRNGIAFDIFTETPVANALICSCMYMRNVLDFHRLIFWIVLGSMPF